MKGEVHILNVDLLEYVYLPEGLKTAVKSVIQAPSLSQLPDIFVSVCWCHSLPLFC